MGKIKGKWFSNTQNKQPMRNTEKYIQCIHFIKTIKLVKLDNPIKIGRKNQIKNEQ
jgi:dimeric dUTPase (all-alpha-NTP-PPase superfamily)